MFSCDILTLRQQGRSVAKGWGGVRAAPVSFLCPERAARRFRAVPAPAAAAALDGGPVTTSDSLAVVSSRRATQARYIGSLVGDFHRTILYGGIYGYPGDAKNKTGKLRLLYECAPMSFIAEQAGGLGSTGQERVLDVDPEKVHQRVPLFCGSKKEVEYLESFTKGK